MLWLTRTPARSNTDYELDLYLNGVIFYIDNVFNAFRNRSSMYDRPRVTATGHKSYNRNPELPPNLIGDFTINVVYWNFFLKYRSEDKETIAYEHGLVASPEPPKIRTIFQTRHTFAQAKRMRKWLVTWAKSRPTSLHSEAFLSYMLRWKYLMKVIFIVSIKIAWSLGYAKPILILTILIPTSSQLNMRMINTSGWLLTTMTSLKN